MKQIDVIISADGTKSEVQPGAGYSGPACLAATAALEGALAGGAKVERKLEKAFYDTTATATVGQGQK